MKKTVKKGNYFEKNRTIPAAQHSLSHYKFHSPQEIEKIEEYG